MVVPRNVASIGDMAFPTSSYLTAIDVDPLNSSYSSVDGVLFDKNQTMLIQYPTGKGTSYTVPSTVTIIGAAFQFNGVVTNLIIPRSVTSIADSAFFQCSKLTAVYFQGNAPGVGGFVFSGANKATVYYLPGTSGWDTTFANRPTAPWFLPNPLILRIGTDAGVPADVFGFLISWATNTSVIVEASTSLANPAWSPIGTNTLANGTSYFIDRQPENNLLRFYRLRSP